MQLRWIESANSHDRDSQNWYELYDDDVCLVAKGNDHEILMELVDRFEIEIDFTRLGSHT